MKIVLGLLLALSQPAAAFTEEDGTEVITLQTIFTWDEEEDDGSWDDLVADPEPVADNDLMMMPLSGWNSKQHV